MNPKQALAEVVKEEPIVFGVLFSLCGQVGDRILGLFPIITIVGFGAGYLLYLWSCKHLESIINGGVRTQ